MIIYSASEADVPKKGDLGQSGEIVKHFLEPYLGTGHILYTDNWYTNPFLAKFFLSHNTGSVGTV